MHKAELMPDHPSEYPQQAAQNNGPSDDVLITMFQGGDALAFRSLVDRHRERVRNVVYSVLNMPDAVDDIAQEVFIKAYEGLAQFRFDSSFYTWLYRITVNRCRDEIRRKKVRRFFSLETLLDSGDHDAIRGMAVQQPDPDTGAFIQAALQRLPARFRIPVILRDIDGLSYTEIAEVLACEEGTVKSRIARGRTQLRVLLQPLLHDEARTADPQILEEPPTLERNEHDVSARPA